MFALGQSFSESCPRRRDFAFLLYQAQVQKNDKKRPDGFRFVEGEPQLGGFAWSFFFHFLPYFFEAAKVSFGLFLEFGELGLDGG